MRLEQWKPAVCIKFIKISLAAIAVRLGRKDPKDNLEELKAEYLELSNRIKQIE